MELTTHDAASPKRNLESPDEVQVAKVPRTGILTIDECSCPVCAEVFYKPFSYTCGHSICFKCSQIHKLNTCSECKHVQGQVPFHRNIALNQMVEKLFPSEYAKRREDCAVLEWRFRNHPNIPMKLSTNLENSVILPILQAFDKAKLWDQPSFPLDYLAKADFFDKSVACFLNAGTVSSLFPRTRKYFNVQWKTWNITGFKFDERDNWLKCLDLPVDPELVMLQKESNS